MESEAGKFARVEFEETSEANPWEVWVDFYFLAAFESKSAAENYMAGINTASDARVKKAEEATKMSEAYNEDLKKRLVAKDKAVREAVERERKALDDAGEQIAHLNNELLAAEKAVRSARAEAFEAGWMGAADFLSDEGWWDLAEKVRKKFRSKSTGGRET